uniref:Uncharacterized protein n=1 Tax=Amphora coffeiformis TaxID=265554 RepID=A0A7S3LBK1_9STRA|eukprot:scaffold9940_cov161-Amphora_coffeaeformis.AAC.3
MTVQSIVCFLLLASSTNAFVGRTPRTVSPARSKTAPPSLRWERQPKSGGSGFWNPFYSPPIEAPLSARTEESFAERLTGYAKRTADSVVDWGTFKPTGSDKTWLGDLQGYANGIEGQLDEVSDWILSYSDLRPDSETTTAGQAFLATNLAYSLAGAYLVQNGDFFFGTLTEITAVASFAYHYGQLESQGVNNLPSVRLSLLIDYILAFTSIGVALFYLATSGGDEVMTVLPPAILSLGALGASWVWYTGRPYMILHGLWHFLSAYTGYLVGAIHSGAV